MDFIIVTFASSILWLIYPWIYNNINVDCGTIFYYYCLLILFIIRKIVNVCPILIARWVSINNYSILRTTRLISQIISFL